MGGFLVFAGRHLSDCEQTTCRYATDEGENPKKVIIIVTLNDRPKRPTGTIISN
jgi:hypothetical protein